MGQKVARGDKGIDRSVKSVSALMNGGLRERKGGWRKGEGKKKENNREFSNVRNKK